MEKQKKCFIISPIGDELTDVRKRSDQVLKYIIQPALEKFGYIGIRADDISDPGLITNQIIAHLINDDLAIADLTGHNPNVFYELGIRHTLNKPVIQIIEKGERLPFDISSIRTIIFDHRDLESVFNTKEALIKAIEALDNSSDPFQGPIVSISNSINVRNQHAIRASAYLKEFSEDNTVKVSQAIKLLTEAFGLEISIEGSPKSGSWFKDWLLKTQELLSEPEVNEKLRKVELALETELLKKKQAEIDKNQAEAVQALIQSIQPTPNAIIQIGSILIVKRTDKDGQSAVIVRNLTSKELITLDEQPSLLQDPNRILKVLEENK